MVELLQNWRRMRGPHRGFVVRLACGLGLARDVGAEGVRGERNERRESLRDSVNLLGTQTLSFPHYLLWFLFGRGPIWRDGLRWSVASSLACRRAAPVSAACRWPHCKDTCKRH